MKMLDMVRNKPTRVQVALPAQLLWPVVEHNHEAKMTVSIVQMPTTTIDPTRSRRILPLAAMRNSTDATASFTRPAETYMVV